MKLEKKVGIFFIVAVLIMVFFLESMEEKLFLKKGYPLKAYFRSVGGLEQGDAVKLAGLKVGEIEKIAIAGDKIEITMLIGRDVSIRTDAEATIKMTSLLGGKYLNLSLGSPSSPALQPGSTITSVDAPDLDELLVKVNTVVSDVEGFTGDVLGEGGAQLKETFARLERLSGKVEGGEGTLGKLITDDTLYKEATKTVQEIGKAAEGVQDQTPIIAFATVLLGISR